MISYGRVRLATKSTPYTLLSTKIVGLLNTYISVALSTEFFLKLNPQYTNSTLENIRTTFNTPDNPIARVLLNTITRSASTLQSRGLLSV